MRLKKAFFTKNKTYGMVSLLILSGMLMGARTYIQNWQVVHDSVMEVVNLPTRSSNQVILDQIDLELNSPLRMHETIGTPDSKLYIESNQITKGDGSLQSTSPSDDEINAFAATTVDYQSGAVTGGTVEVEGATFSLPACTTGQYRYHVYKYQSASNKLETKFGDEAASIGALTNVGSVFASIDGTPVGYLILECTATGQYKTAGSATSIIQNKVGSDSRIVRFGSGAGGGAGEVTDFKLQSVATTGVTVIKGGRYLLSDGKVIATYDGSGSASTDFEVDLTIDLDNVLATPSDDTTYSLYVDLLSLNATPTTLSDDGRLLYPVVESNFSLKTESPEELSDLYRYVYIGTVRRATAEWSSTVKVTSPIKVATVPSTIVTPIEYTMDYTAVGSIGSASQLKAGHVLTSGSFPSGADVSWYGLTDVNDGNTTNAHNLTNNGTAVFTSSGILGVSNSALVLNGTTQYLSSTDAYFNPGDGDFTVGGWYEATDWSPASEQVLFAQWPNITNKSFSLRLNTDGSLSLFTSVDGTTDINNSISMSELASGWHHFSVRYTASSDQFDVYVDGFLAGTATLSSSLNQNGTAEFSIGSWLGGNTYFSGSIDEFFFVTDTALSDNAIHRIYAAKISHNKGITPKDQSWIATGKNSNIEIPISDYIIDKDLNDLYIDLSGEDTTTQVALKLQNSSASGRVSAVRSLKRDDTATNVDAMLPITHGLPEKPTHLELWVESSGYWELHDAGTYFKVSATQIASTGTTLASVLGGSTNVSLIASVGGAAVYSTASGVGGWSTVVTTSTTTATNGEEHLVNTTGGAVTINLPASPSIGYRVKFIDFNGNFGTNSLTIGRNGNTIMGSAADLTLSTDGDYATLVFNGSGDWRLI